jgi:hypothetical protein
MSELAPALRQLFDYWRARSQQRLPTRADVDLIADLPRLAATAALIEVIDQRQFRYRILGSTLVERARRNLTGRMIDRDIYGDELDDVLRPLREVVAQRRPVRVRGVARGVRKMNTPIEALCVPLAAQAGDELVGFILVVMVYETKPTFELAEPGAQPFELITCDVC